MASSYGYVKREVQDMQINWAEVGQNFRNVLDEEARVRQDKKDAIDKDTREYEKRVTDSNLLGRDTKFNEGVLMMGADAQHMSRMNTMLLKSGQLKPRDYTIMTQNMIDGTNNVFKVIESYNNLQADVMDGVNSKEFSEDMLSNWAVVQDMANFNDNRIMFNPYTGEVNVARMVEDPANPTGPRIPSNDASKLQSVQSLLNITNDNVLRYKMIEHINDNIKTLEPIVMQKINEMGGTYKKGTLIKYTSFFSKRTGGFDELSKEEKEQLAADLDMDVSSAGMLGSMHKTISDYADSQVEFDRNGMSILIDFKKVSDDGVPYSTTFNEEDTKDANGDRDENVILKKQENGRIIYELTDTQKKEAKNVFINQLTSRLAESTETSTVDMFKEADVVNLKYSDDKKEKIKKSKEFGTMLSNFYYGDATEVAASETFFRDLLGLVDFQKIDDVAYLTSYSANDPEKLETTAVSMLDEDGNLMSFELFAKAAMPGMSNNQDLDEAVALSGGTRKGVVESVKVATAPTVENGKSIKGTVTITFEDGRVETRTGTVSDFKPGSEIEKGSMTKTGKGATTTVSEGDDDYKNRYIAAIVDGATLKTLTKGGKTAVSPTKLKTHLEGLSTLGFTVTDDYTPNQVSIKSEGGVVSVFDTSLTGAAMDKQIKVLEAFISSNTSAEKLVEASAAIKILIGNKKGSKPDDKKGSQPDGKKVDALGNPIE